MKTTTVQEICCFVFGVLLFLIRQESRAETKINIVHEVGSSLDLIPDYPKTNLTLVQWKFNQTLFAEYDNLMLTQVHPDMFNKRLQINQNNLKVTLKNLQLQDSGIFTIVHEGHGTQHETKTIVLLVYGTLQTYLMFIVIGAGIVSFFIVIGITGGCYRWRTQQGNRESQDGITVYEDVNTDAITKKRSESVINGMRIYESVDDVKVTSSAPQTVYDKISYQRHPGVTPSTSSPYQEVL